ncbi:hypothetical protein C1646_767659 [Rhizophagus diaphanus]|nr:hypothetical protein C1646_767659 [Rhizophagus diaphanus] [Rhizophagus sp. MUCL 43196]
MSQKRDRGRPSLSARSSTHSLTSTASSTTVIGSSITLLCLVYGEPPSSYFKIKVGNNDDTDNLKELIKKKNEPDFDKFALRKLKLWVVDLPFNSANLGDSNVNIANVLQGQEFLSPNKISDIFTIQPNEANIHIIVELPTSYAPAAGENVNKILARLNSINKDVKDIKSMQQQSEQQISIVNASDWNKNQVFYGLDNIEAVNLSIEHLGLNKNNIVMVNAFSWDERNDRAQHDRYIPYLNQILRIGTYQTLAIFDPTSNADFLMTDAGIYLPLRLAGTTDAVVVDRFSVTAMFSDCHIRIVFELKKKVEYKDRYQALAELITSDLRSNYTVLTVLTDLNDVWVFFWFEQKKVKTLSLPRDIAVALINNNMKLADQENTAKENNQNKESEEGASTKGQESFPKKQKLKHIVTSNVSSDIASIEDFFDTMTEKEIFKYKIKRVLTQFFSRPIFSELNNH